MIRWLLKDDGWETWDTLPLRPVVAWNPSKLNTPIIVGIAVEGELFASKWEFPEYLEFQEWVDYLMEMDNYNSPVEALLDHKMALIPTEEDIMAADIMGWQSVMEEVIEGSQENTNTSVIDDDSIDEISTFFGLLDSVMGSFGFMPSYNSRVFKVETAEDAKFSKNFQNKWI